jgi:hypothetical protein
VCIWVPGGGVIYVHILLLVGSYKFTCHCVVYVCLVWCMVLVGELVTASVMYKIKMRYKKQGCGTILSLWYCGLTPTRSGVHC